MTENMNILIVEPGKSPRPTQIPNTLEAMDLSENFIERCYAGKLGSIYHNS